MTTSEHKFHICIDIVNYTVKPPKKEVGQIVNRITKNEVELTLAELSLELINGKTVCGRFGKKSKSDENFQSADTIFIDIDNKEPGVAPLYPEHAIERLQRFGIYTSLAYHTHSSTDEIPKYRIVIHLDGIVTSGPLLKHLLQLLVSIIPECDPASKKISQMYYGGRTIIHYNDAAIVTLNNIFSAYRSYVYETDKSHAAAKARSSASTLMRLLFPEHIINDSIRTSKYGGSKDLESPHFTCTFHGSSNESTNLVSLMECLLRYCSKDFHSQNGSPCKINVDKSTLIESEQYANAHPFNNESETINNRCLLEQYQRRTIPVPSRSSKKIKNFNFNVLESRCALFRKFLHGKIGHIRKVHLAACLSNIENGEKLFFEHYLNPDRDKIEEFRKIFRMHYRPSPCSKFCDYVDSCMHPSDITEIGRKRKYGQIERIVTAHEPIGLKEADKINHFNLDMALEFNDTDIWLHNGPPGIGKTELILKKKCLQNAVIAAPNHALKREIASRAQQMGHDAMVTPELPTLPAYAMSVLTRMYRLNPAKAGSYKWMLCSEFPQMRQYFDDFERCMNHPGLIVTTHEMLVRRKIGWDRTIIVDEDITQTLLLNNECSVSDVMKLGRFVSSNINEVDGKAILDSTSTSMSPYSFKQNSIHIINKDKIEKAGYNINLQSNVVGFLNCTSYIVEGGKISYITKRSLPDNAKIIVMSATADKMVYERLCEGRTVHYNDIGAVRTMGRLVQYIQRGVSRESLINYPLLPRKIEEIASNQPVITYKSHKDKFVNAIRDLHFGKCMGVDGCKGHDLVVVGTPHFNPNVYGLYASALGIPFTANDFLTFGTTDVWWNGYIFKFPSFVDNLELQHLQLHLIRSELVQAVGRNRILREDCTTTVFSNLPLAGADLRPFDPRLTAKSCQVPSLMPTNN